jgi:hypothetical protein
MQGGKSCNFAFNKLKNKKMDFLHSDLSAQKASNSGAMKKVLQNKDMVKILPKASQRQEFYNALKQNKGDVSKTLGQLDRNKKDSITSDAANRIRRAMGERFDYSGYRKNLDASRQEAASGRISTQSSRAKAASPGQVPLSARLTKTNSSVMRSLRSGLM